MSNRSQFLLKLTIKTTESSHDGYCSDPSSPRQESEIKHKFIPIPDTLNSDDMDRDGNIKIYPLPDWLKHYQRIETHCWCGRSRTETTIQSAKIVLDIKSIFAES